MKVKVFRARGEKELEGEINTWLAQKPNARIYTSIYKNIGFAFWPEHLMILFYYTENGDVK